MPLDRLLLVVLVTALVVLAGLIVRWWIRRTAASVRARLAPLPHPATETTAPVTLLNFSSPQCGTCHRVQKPLVEKVSAQFANQVVVVEVDALAQADLARAYRVLTVPSTVIITGNRVQEMNYGLASAETLDRQLRAALTAADLAAA